MCCACLTEAHIIVSVWSGILCTFCLVWQRFQLCIYSRTRFLCLTQCCGLVNSSSYELGVVGGTVGESLCIHKLDIQLSLKEGLILL